jgi:hypothetical protein
MASMLAGHSNYSHPGGYSTTRIELPDASSDGIFMD